ncbi:MAG TPA: phosphotransferase [Candidatus Limnocylindrales bacterium]|jgi:thiamine kinase-like enzyme
MAEPPRHLGAEEPNDRGLTDELAAALERVPELAGRSLVLTILSGGITNRNFRVDADGGLGAPGGSTYVLRRAGTDTHLLGIRRDVEYAATLGAAAVGVGPEVIAFIRPECFLVTRFIPGVGISEAAVHDPDMIRRVADSIRRIHGGPAIPGTFDPVRIGETYRALAAQRGVTIPAAYEPAREQVRRIERALVVDPVDMRPCHNDLLNANFIDDGERVRIVDWEYAGMGDPFFDLGNFSVNHDLDADEDAALLEAYAGEVRPAHLARLRVLRVVSDFREAMWGVLQQAISMLDVDFEAYAERHFERLLDSASRPGFEAALATLDPADDARSP